MLYASVDDIIIACIGAQEWPLKLSALGLSNLIQLMQGPGFKVNGAKSVKGIILAAALPNNAAVAVYAEYSRAAMQARDVPLASNLSNPAIRSFGA